MLLKVNWTESFTASASALAGEAGAVEGVHCTLLRATVPRGGASLYTAVAPVMVALEMLLSASSQTASPRKMACAGVNNVFGAVPPPHAAAPSAAAAARPKRPRDDLRSCGMSGHLAL